MRKGIFSLFLTLSLGVLLLPHTVLARREITKDIWDGNLTNAKSGVEGELEDPGSTEGKSGIKNPPQTFFTPPPRQYADVDLQEEADIRHQRHKEYSPYALARFTQTFAYQGKKLPKGYYQVKLGASGAGSEATNLQGVEGVHRTLVLKQLGKVIAVLPVEHVQPVRLSRKEKKEYKNPVATVVFENHTPVLQYHTATAVFSTELE